MHHRSCRRAAARPGPPHEVHSVPLAVASVGWTPSMVVFSRDTEMLAVVGAGGDVHLLTETAAEAPKRTRVGRSLRTSAVRARGGLK